MVYVDTTAVAILSLQIAISGYGLVQHSMVGPKLALHLK
jgi:hypothetical protein